MCVGSSCKMTRLAGILLLLAMLWTGFSPTALEGQSSLDVSQYVHRAWTAQGGSFRGAVESVSQTRDGYIWIGTGFALLRFDGVRFIDWHPDPKGDQLPKAPFYEVLGTKDGSLWVAGTGLAQLKDGKLTRYASLDGIHFSSIVEAPDGTIWAAGTGKPSTYLCSIRNGEAKCFSDSKVLGTWVRSLYEDAAGQLWAGTGTGLWKLQPGPPRHYSQLDEKFRDSDSIIHDISQDSQGRLLLAYDFSIGFLGRDDRIDFDPLRVNGRPVPASHFLTDREGGLWIGAEGVGIVHVSHGKVDTFSKADSLTANTIRGLFQDHEGDIWVATETGLDEFRKPAVPSFTEREGLSSNTALSVLTTRGGDIWVGTENGLDHIEENGVTRLGREQGLPIEHIASLFETSRGRLLVATNIRNGMTWLDNGRVKLIRGTDSGGNVFGVAEDSRGELWMSNRESGLMHLKSDGTLISATPFVKVGAGAYSLAYDPVLDGLWFGGNRGELSLYKNGGIVKRYGSQDGLGEGMLRDIHVDKDGVVWVGTRVGLARLENGKFEVLNHNNGLPCDVIHWMRYDNEHDMWLYTECGLVRISKQDIDAWAVRPSRKVAVLDYYDARDGAENLSDVAYYTPSAAIAKDGRIFFVTSSGIGVLDTKNLSHNTLLPPVHIEEVIADGVSFAPSKQYQLPKHVHQIRIAFTALSLILPEKVQFRYRLKGVDKDWSDPQTTRETSYTNLSPGSYTFEVIACNNDGLWNPTGDSIVVTIPASFEQTLTFRCLLVALFMACTWGVYFWRLQHVRIRLQERMAERLGERERIARDLHDTLLQGFQLLTLVFQASMRHMSSEDPNRKTMGHALGQADKVLVEARNAIRNLRADEDTPQSLSDALSEVASQLPQEMPVEFNLSCTGELKLLNPALREELFRIGQEALINAYQHSGASRIDVDISYGAAHLEIIIRDNGTGITQDLLADGRKGHWGLSGMRERAKSIGGELSIRTGAGTGTMICITVLGKLAYRALESRHRWERFKSFALRKDKFDPRK
jgi:signal transduction histidine kinase/ligand-binding sensor domain-containing protein